MYTKCQMEGRDGLVMKDYPCVTKLAQQLRCNAAISGSSAGYDAAIPMPGFRLFLQAAAQVLRVNLGQPGLQFWIVHRGISFAAAKSSADGQSAHGLSPRAMRSVISA